MKILLTGFDPFGGEPVNPAEEAVKMVSDNIRLISFYLMKILQINVFNYRKGGSEVVYFSTMELLRMHGEEVVNFALRWPENYPSEYESYFPESKETRSELLKPV